MSNYFLAIYPLNSSTGHHITIGYFQGVTPSEIHTIESSWEQYVRMKVIPEKIGNQYVYISKQGTHYYFDKPLSPSGNSILVKGALEKMIYNFRNYLQSNYPSIYAKISKRMLEPHISVGPALASNWRSLSIGPFILIQGTVSASPLLQNVRPRLLPARIPQVYVVKVKNNARSRSPVRKTHSHKSHTRKTKSRSKSRK